MISLWPALLLLTVLALPLQAKQGYALSLKVFKVIDEVETLLDEDRPKQALKELGQQLKKKLSPYEQAQLWYLSGSIHYRQSNNSAAIHAFSQVLLSEGQMPDYLYLRTLKTLSQLHLVNEELAPALQYCQRLLSQIEGKNAENYALLAQIHYRRNDYLNAKAAAAQARIVLKTQHKQPPENLLLLQNAVFFELNDMQSMEAVLKTLLEYYPKPSYLLYLASVYGHLDQIDKQTALMETLYEQGSLKGEAQFVQLANLYLAEKVPHKAAVLLEKSIESEKVKPNQRHYELLAQAWLLAAHWDKATQVLGLAAKQSKDGELYLRQAQLLFEMAQWNRAEQALTNAFSKGLAKDKSGNAWLLLGMIQFQHNRFTQAIEACEKAKAYAKTRQHSENWISYIASEKAKFDAMKEWQ